ncbi:MAG: 2-polyprenylphenol 6-hydroxylase [Gammaproteobacteria bacterium]|nr:2-polyprenylphenol 6-hydroxylase [Gammaproteobacteria bacterium]
MNQFKILARILKIQKILVYYHLDDLIEDIPVLKPLQWFFYLSPKRWLRNKSKESKAERIRKALETLGPLYVKFGQSLSTRPDLLPPDIAEELAKLQDNVPAFPPEQAQLEIENAFDEPADKIFKSFDATAFASASVAQAHLAQLHTGEEVVVKILRPGILAAIEQDMEILFLIAKLVERYSQEGRRLKPLEVVSDYQKTVHNELDLMREAANCAQIGRNWKDSDIIRVPEIYWDFCRQNILVQERIRGIPINDIDGLLGAGVDIHQLAINGVKIFFTQVFHHNLFHADMHPGNVFVDISDPKNPKYAAVDFGIVGSLEDRDLRYLARSFAAFFEQDYNKIAHGFLDAGWVPKDTRIDEFEASIRTVCDPISDKPLKDISFGQLLFQLFQTARQFKMENQPQLVQLEKTLLNIEGLGRQLYPDLDLVEAAKPILDDWRDKQTDLKTLVRKLQYDAPQFRETLENLPKLARKLLEDTNQSRPIQPATIDVGIIFKSLYLCIIGMALFISGITLLAIKSVSYWFAWIMVILGVGLTIKAKPK